MEGRQAVGELLRAGRRRVHYLTAAEGLDLGEVELLAAQAGVEVRRVPRLRFDGMALTAAPQGVIARADPLVGMPLDELAGRPGPVVVLDGVTDPANLGAIMRSALGAGVSGVVVGQHRAVQMTPAAVKSAAGAVEYLPLSVVPGVPSALSRLVDLGRWTVGLEADGPTSLWDLPVADQPLAVVLGAEGAGLGRLVRERCQVLARIPLSGPIRSLNVSAAAAVVFFELARRSGGTPQLG